jgi:hypothetical protein
MNVLMSVVFIILVFVGVWCLAGLWSYIEHERFWRRLR